MTQEALKLALEYIQAVPDDRYNAEHIDRDALITAIKETLAQTQEPVKIAHRHEWFSTGEMKVGQMRCINCGTWGHEEMPQRTWVGLTRDEQSFVYSSLHNATSREDSFWVDFANAIEAELKEKNT